MPSEAVASFTPRPYLSVRNSVPSLLRWSASPAFFTWLRKYSTSLLRSLATTAKHTVMLVLRPSLAQRSNTVFVTNPCVIWQPSTEKTGTPPSAAYVTGKEHTLICKHDKKGVCSRVCRDMQGNSEFIDAAWNACRLLCLPNPIVASYDMATFTQEQLYVPPYPPAED